METLLIISLAVNLLSGWGYLDQRDKATAATQTATTAREVADQCSRSVAGLQAAAAQREREAAVAREEADRLAGALDAQADAELARSPAAPGDTCKSAQTRVDLWKGGGR